MNRLKELRKSRRMTQTEVAQMMGIGQSGYSFWESGRSKIDNASLQKLATFYHVSVDYLLGNDPQTSPAPTEPSENTIKAAFFNGADPSLTPEEQDELWEDAKEYFRFKIEQRRNKQKNEK